MFCINFLFCLPEIIKLKVLTTLNAVLVQLMGPKYKLYFIRLWCIQSWWAVKLFQALWKLIYYIKIFLFTSLVFFWIPGPSSRSAIQLRRAWNSVLNVLRIFFWGMILKIQISPEFQNSPKPWMIFFPILFSLKRLFEFKMSFLTFDNFFGSIIKEQISPS